MEHYNKQKYKNDYCNNCGNFGHLYKNCRHPILSYGIILYCKLEGDEDKDKKMILIERKDSISYIEFLRGKYPSIYDIEYLKLLFSRLSKEELNKIVSYDFDKLWNDLWIDTNTINHKIRKEYSKSKENFIALKKGFDYRGTGINLEYFIKHSSPCKYLENEWEIPKGRRKKYETNRECAIREFEEETNINQKEYKLYNNIIPMIEEYVGINGVRYKHVYYIGEIQKHCPLYINKNNKNQFTEIKSIGWFTKEEGLQHIRDYDENKKKIILDFFNFLDIQKNHITIK